MSKWSAEGDRGAIRAISQRTSGCEGAESSTSVPNVPKVAKLPKVASWATRISAKEGEVCEKREAGTAHDAVANAPEEGGNIRPIAAK